LVQQLFAVDRERASSTTDELNQRPEVWQLIKKVAQAAQAHGRPLSVCGEMASVPHYIQRFTELGIHAFSVDIAKIKELKKAAGIGATD
jgi:phosphotransferase system enzyme I (PtsI)